MIRYWTFVLKFKKNPEIIRNKILLFGNIYNICIFLNSIVGNEHVYLDLVTERVYFG